MCAAKNNAEGVAKLLIEAKANLDAKDEVRPVGRCTSAVRAAGRGRRADLPPGQRPGRLGA